MKSNLSERQQAIYEFIRTVTADSSMPPSMREIGEKFGIRSTNGVEKHLQALERSGHINRVRGKSRGIAVISGLRTASNVPLMGRVAAGVPVLSPENREGDIAIDLSLFSLKTPHQVFALGVRGESMIDAHILDGDTVLVREQATARNGDIVVAVVEDEATVKRFFLENDRIRLQPENRNMAPLYFDRGDLRIIGKVVGVMRKL